MKDDLGDLSSGMDRVDRPAKAAVDEERQAPAVIEMTVGQEDRVDLGRIERERLLVELCDVVSLERPAVDEDPPPARLDPMAAARHRERGARAEGASPKRPVRGSARGPLRSPSPAAVGSSRRDSRCC